MLRRSALKGMELICEVQNYDWGKVGNLSEVAEIAQFNQSDFKVRDDVPYAEFWMGTHPNAPSKLKSSGESLKSWIKNHQESLGISKPKFGDDLSFLFKVLSINKALSIQAHPAKDHAEKLHREKPDIYKDPNHKPEMAIALTPFEVLVGFRPYPEIKKFFDDVPELCELVNEDNANKFIIGNDDPSLLKTCFNTMMNQSDHAVANAVEALVKRLSAAGKEIKERQMFNLVDRLNTQFKNDVGIFGVYFFNYVKLKPGEAVYLGANFPHAYISGDCVECMACSDNVVRAGLTPKLKDVETLVEMLDYTGYKPADLLLKGKDVDDNTQAFNPPIPDFSLTSIKIMTDHEYKVPKKQSASILLILCGKGQLQDGLKVSKGTVLFIPAGDQMKIKCTENITAYQAASNDIML